MSPEPQDNLIREQRESERQDMTHWGCNTARNLVTANSWHPKIFPAGFELAVMFPPSFGFKGASTTIPDVANRYGPFFSRGEKFTAVRLIMRHAFECQEAHGHGNKAAKREAQLSTMRDECLHEAMAERDAFFKQQLQKRLNYHDL